MKKFFVNVDGILIDNGKLLLVRRATEPFKGSWALVGGSVDENETLREALKREFMEEVNLDVEVGEILGGRIEETFDRTKIIIVFHVTESKGEIKLNSENYEYGWFNAIPKNSVYDYSEYCSRNLKR